MKRRVYSREFKVSAVKLVQEQGYTIGKAAEHLGIDPGSLRAWVHKFGTPPSEVPEAVGEPAMRAECRRLREENRQLRMEREILKKAATYFASQQP